MAGFLVLVEMLVTPCPQFPRFPSPDPVSPRLIKRFTHLHSSFRTRDFACNSFVLLILQLAPEVHEAGSLIDIGVNYFAVLDVTFDRVRSCSKVPHLPLGGRPRENLKTGCRQQRLSPSCRPSETVQSDTD